MRAIGTLLGMHTNPLRAELSPRLGLEVCPLGEKCQSQTNSGAWNAKGGPWPLIFESNQVRGIYILLLAKHVENRRQDPRIKRFADSGQSRHPINHSKW